MSCWLPLVGGPAGRGSAVEEEAPAELRFKVGQRVVGREESAGVPKQDESLKMVFMGGDSAGCMGAGASSGRPAAGGVPQPRVCRVRMRVASRSSHFRSSHSR